MIQPSYSFSVSKLKNRINLLKKSYFFSHRHNTMYLIKDATVDLKAFCKVRQAKLRKEVSGVFLDNNDFI